MNRVPVSCIVEMYGKTYRGGEFLPFYVPRSEMPQIDEVRLPELVRDAVSGGPGCAFQVYQVSELHAHQRIDHALAQAMNAHAKLKPVLVSSDGYILDGNHRWWAHVHAGDEWINAIRINLSFDEAIKWLLEQPYTYRLTEADLQQWHASHTGERA